MTCAGQVHAPYRHDCSLILYADAALIVANKPAGLLAVPGRGPDKADCLAARVAAVYADAQVVHRLDMDTSGLICFGRGAAAQRALSMAFAARAVHKIYIADVVASSDLVGASAGDWQTIDLPLIVDWPNRPRSKVDHDIGKPSVTRWRVLAHDAARGRARVELQPVTGRSHQLRVHLAAIGMPIVGDPLYGNGQPAARMHLHASQLTVPHPVSGEAMQFASPPPF